MDAIVIPKDFQNVLEKEKGESSVPRWALETMVVGALREGLITERFAGHVLGFSSFEDRERFLSEHGIAHDYNVEELRDQQYAIDEAMRTA